MAPHPPRAYTSPDRPQTQRSLVGYLMVPRPHDLIKGAMIAVVYLIAALGVGDLDARSVLRAVIVVFAVELLIYAARYQWNDIRGFRADQEHPDCAARGRLPGPIGREQPHKLASSVTAVAKMVAVIALVVMLPGLDLAPILLVSVLGVFGAAVAYETLRGVATGRPGDGPAESRPLVIALWVVVGIGYAVRGLIGLALAVDLTARPALTVVAGVTLWAYGIAFVTSRWSLEALAFARSDRGRIRWDFRASQAREHQSALVRWLPTEFPASGAPSGGVATIRDWAPLAGRTSLGAPWNLAMVLAGAGAVATGALLAGETVSLSTAAFGVLGAAVTVAVLAVDRRRPAAVGIGVLVVGAAAVSQHLPSTVIVVVPWIAVMAAHQFFSTRTSATLGRTNPIVDMGRRLVATGGQRLQAPGPSSGPVLATAGDGR